MEMIAEMLHTETPGAKEEQMLFARLRTARETGDEQTTQEIRDLMCRAHIGLVTKVAKSFWGIDFEDLIMEGEFALVRAIDRFDERKGWKFSSYAVMIIANQMNKETERVWKRRNVHKITSDEFRVPDTPCSDREAELEELREQLNHALETSGLTPIEATVVRRYYGVTGYNKETLRTLGQEIGVDGERIRQIRNQALIKLKSSFEARDI